MDVERLQTPSPEVPPALSENESPVRLGFQAGLFMDVCFGALGIRTGASLINTGALFDAANFLTASVNAKFN